jgi:hypothetical protein
MSIRPPEFVSLKIVFFSQKVQPFSTRITGKLGKLVLPLTGDLRNITVGEQKAPEELGSKSQGRGRGFVAQHSLSKVKANYSSANLTSCPHT